MSTKSTKAYGHQCCQRIPKDAFFNWLITIRLARSIWSQRWQHMNIILQQLLINHYGYNMPTLTLNSWSCMIQFKKQFLSHINKWGGMHSKKTIMQQNELLFQCNNAHYMSIMVTIHINACGWIICKPSHIIHISLSFMAYLLYTLRFNDKELLHFQSLECNVWA